MTVGQFLESATKKLYRSSIDTARLDCLILLEDALGLNRASLIAHPETEIPQTTEVDLNKKIVQRSHHLPLAYIRKKVEFYGRQFKINSKVLVPRPETEDIINLLLVEASENPPLIADIGAGSGCIGITAALELPGSNVDLYDISPHALEVSKQNALELNAPVNICKSDLLKAAGPNYDIILANLPYVPDDYPINRAASHEPSIALFSGSDGMSLYRDFWEQIGQKSSKPGLIIIESLQDQHQTNIGLAKLQGYMLSNTAGLAQAFKLT